MKSEELSRILRFSIIGVTVAAIYVTAYLILIGLGSAAFPANLLAFTTAVVFQYFAQTTWTFRRRLRDRHQIFRFLISIGIGFLYSTFVVSMLSPILAWSHMFSAMLVAFTLPVINYCVFRFWVYAQRSEAEEI